MIKVDVLYPNSPGAKFDMDYYLNKHMKLVAEKSGSACKGMAVEQGIAGGAPGAPGGVVTARGTTLCAIQQKPGMV